METTGISPAPNIFAITLPASAMLPALKITKLTITKSIVYICPDTLLFFNNVSKNIFSNIRKNAIYSPHTTKFHAAPCHNPVNAHTIIMFKNHFHILTLLPPSGIYT